jgi:hypothetical protein
MLAAELPRSAGVTLPMGSNCQLLLRLPVATTITAKTLTFTAIIGLNRSRIAYGVLAILSIAMIANDRPWWILAGGDNDGIMTGARTMDRVIYDWVMARSGSVQRPVARGLFLMMVALMVTLRIFVAVSLNIIVLPIVASKGTARARSNEQKDRTTCNEIQCCV